MTPVGQRWVLRLWGHGDFCSTCKDLSVCRVSSKSHGGSFPIESFPYPDNGTFGDLCRSNGRSYNFGAKETFVQYAKIYKYTNFHPNRTGGKFPIGSLPCPLLIAITVVYTQVVY